MFIKRFPTKNNKVQFKQWYMFFCEVVGEEELKKPEILFTLFSLVFVAESPERRGLAYWFVEK
jgi:hypothetical protein